MEPKIIYQDQDLLALSKPSGMVVNRSQTTKGMVTIQDWIDKKFDFAAQEKGELDNDFINRSGIVHRLDKDTSGVLVVAKNPSSFLKLQSQFKERLTRKIYLALVHGEMKSKQGKITAPISRNPFNRRQFGVFVPMGTIYFRDVTQVNSIAVHPGRGLQVDGHLRCRPDRNGSQ